MKTWREQLQEVGGYDNDLVGIPAGAVRKMVDEIERLEREVSKVKSLEGMTLTALEIGDLASAAGFSLPPEAWPDADDLETEFTVVAPDQSAGVRNDDGEIEHYAHIAYLEEYPEEGVFPLGEKVVTNADT